VNPEDKRKEEAKDKEMKHPYKEINFRKSTRLTINLANEILADYEAEGLRLTVRQVFYQLVSRNHIENNEKKYKYVGRTLRDGRLAGLIDWDSIEDRTRAFIRRTRWGSAKEILFSAACSFHMDMWEGQEIRPFVVIEKDALSGVLEDVCNEYDVPLLANKGYGSVSTLRAFARNDLFPLLYPEGQKVVILYLGDHDPSGMEMQRVLGESLSLFAIGGTEYYSGTHRDRIPVKRIALNQDQVEDLNLPPQFAKQTDNNYEKYVRLYGKESWELDAVGTKYLINLVKTEVSDLIDKKIWKERQKEIKSIKGKLRKVAKNFR
jgi:hypothetical protein